MSSPMRSVAVLVVLALVAGACTKTDADTTTTVVRNSPEAKAMIDAALGGTQSVQDFAIYLDLVLMPEEGGLVSFYDDVRDQATIGAGDPVGLADGFTLVPVSSLRGGVTAPDGSLLPTISLDFALLEASTVLVEETRRSLIDAFETAGEPELAEAFTPRGSAGAPLLVQIATADYTQRRVQVGLGDRAIIDLTFLDAINPGVRIATVHLFGQTLPGDRAAETGLSAFELFAYRWNQGLVAMLGDERGVTTVIDDTLTVAAGPTVGVAPLRRHVSLRETSVALSVSDSAVAQQPVNYQVPGTMPPNVVPETTPPAEIDWDAIESFFVSALKPLELAAATVQGARIGEEYARRVLDHLFEHGRFLSVQDDESLCAVRTESPAPGQEDIWEFGVPIMSPEGEPLCGDRIEMDPEDFVRVFAIRTATQHCRNAAYLIFQRNSPSALIPASTPSSGGNGSDGEEPDPPDQPDPPDPPEPSDPSDPPDPSDLCDPPDPPLPPGFPLGALLGDVHLRTFDRLAYSNQAAGEFLLFDNGLATIHMRTEPLQGFDSVSVGTALAVRIGEQTVSLHAGGETWIDGELAQLARGEAVAVGEAALLWWKGGWVIVWPDDTRLEVTDFGPELLAFVTPSSRSTIGMLGDGDGDPANDLMTRSGDLFQVPPRPSGGYDDAFYESFYSTYIDSWRITQEESLFHYGPGESTATFTIEGFPARFARVSDLDPQTRADAEEVCRAGGVTREDLLEDCTLDVGFTGERRFAYAHYLVEARTEPALRSSASVGPVTPKDDASIVTIGGLTVDFGPDAPLRDPSRTSRWECSTDQGQFRVFSTFAESPTRSFDITVLYGSADTNPTGVESFAVVIRLNAEDYAWTGITIDDVQPFAIDQLTLDGNTLTASGTAYLNDPPRPNAFPFVVPEGANLQRFALQTTCDQ